MLKIVKKAILSSSVLAMLLLGFSVLVPPAQTYAAPQAVTPAEYCANGKCADPAADKAACKSNKCDFVGKYINPGINLLSMAFGLIAVISLIMGGIQYSASSGDPQNVSLAKKRITNTVLAIICYFFFYAFLQFLIPGGLF